VWTQAELVEHIDPRKLAVQVHARSWAETASRLLQASIQKADRFRLARASHRSAHHTGNRSRGTTSDPGHFTLILAPNPAAPGDVTESHFARSRHSKPLSGIERLSNAATRWKHRIQRMGIGVPLTQSVSPSSLCRGQLPSMRPTPLALAAQFGEEDAHHPHFSTTSPQFHSM
jgi:hypothetical protein